MAVSACMCVCVCVNVRRNRGKDRGGSCRQGQSYLYKSSDLVFFTLTLLSVRISVCVTSALPFSTASVDLGGLEMAKTKSLATQEKKMQMLHRPKLV